MLMLTVREGERVSLTLPSGEEIIVVRSDGDRIGIEAPKTVSILRNTAKRRFPSRHAGDKDSSGKLSGLSSSGGSGDD